MQIANMTCYDGAAIIRFAGGGYNFPVFSGSSGQDNSGMTAKCLSVGAVQEIPRRMAGLLHLDLCRAFGAA